MRHKYSIRITEDQKDLIISEQAEVDKDMYSVLCEERFSMEAIKPAAAEGEPALVDALRSVNFYPPNEYASQIATAVAEMLGGGAPERRELLIDDRQVMEAEEAEAAELAAAASEETVPPADEELDDLLKDDDTPAIPSIKGDDAGETEDN